MVDRLGLFWSIDVAVADSYGVMTRHLRQESWQNLVNHKFYHEKIEGLTKHIDQTA